MSNFDLKILCVDDEKAILEIYRTAIQTVGFTPILCDNPRDAIEQFKENLSNIALVLCDFQMPDLSGFEFRKCILPNGATVPFVIVSGYVTKEMALEALNLKIDAFIDKPIAEEEIGNLVEKYAKSRVETIRESQALEQVFIEEVTTILDEMDPVLLSLDQDRANLDKLNQVFRGAHTIKGSSGVLTCDVVTRYVHKYEDIISAIKKGQLELSDATYEILLKGFDRIKELIAAVTAKTITQYQLDKLLPELELNQANKVPGEPQKAGPAPHVVSSTAQKPKENIAVPIEMLEKLSACSGEITVIRNMVNKLVKSLERQHSGNRDIQNLGELLDEMHKINATIQTHITDLRKVPLSGVLKPIPRIIRDLAKDLKKSITLKIDGEKLRVDNALSAVCSNSLVHLVRNSADHGIEDPATRKSLGKPESGSIAITCREVGDEVHISISDDGRGIDPEKIRAKALEKGLFTAQQLGEMTEQQSLGIIFASGFSTAAQVTDVSGRGVGMDMVKSSVEAVGGQIQIDSKFGHGSTFNLKLPIPKSVLIITSLLVEVDNRIFAIPQDSILRVMRIEPEQIESMVQMASVGPTLRSGDDVFPLVTLNSVLGLKSKHRNHSVEKSHETMEVLILETDQIRFALLVDAIHDAEEIVVKRLPQYFNAKGAFTGATFMGDGTVGLIIDVKGIADLAGFKPQESSAKTVSRQNLVNTKPSADASNSRDFLLFQLGTKALFGVSLDQVFRLEEFESGQIQRSGAERVIVYRNGIMPVYKVHQLLNLPGARSNSESNDDDSRNENSRIPAIVARANDGFYGLQVEKVVDIAAAEGDVSPAIRDRKGVIGNVLIREHNVTVIDLSTVLGLSLSA